MKFLDEMHKYKTMSSYCWNCTKNTKSINPRFSKTSNCKTMLDVVVKNQDLIKKQEATEISSNLGLKIKLPLNKIPLLGDILFW